MRTLILGLLLTSAFTASALELKWPEGTARGFPVVYDESGKLIARGVLSQWLQGGHLHVRGEFSYFDGRKVVEESVLAQKPELAQLTWKWEERRGAEVLRSFSVDFLTGRATAHKAGEDAKEETLDDARKTGQAFAGVGFLFAARNLVGRLDRGETVKLTAVAFTPKPRTATVSLRREGVDTLYLGGAKLEADRIVVHPEVPAIAKLFVKAPDQRLWYFRPDPPAFLQAQLPLLEPSDPMQRIDLMPETPRSVARHPTQSGRHR